MLPSPLEFLAILFELCQRSQSGLGSQNGDHVPTAFEPGHLLDFRTILKLQDNAVKNFFATIVVRVLSTSEDDVQLNLVFVLKKIPSLLNLEFDVVFAGLGTQANFLKLHLMLLGGIRVFSLLLVLELAVIHDTAHRRTLVRSDLNEVHADFDRDAHRFGGGNHAQHFAFVINHTDRRETNLVIDTMRSFDGCDLRSGMNCEHLPAGCANVDIAATRHRRLGKSC